LNSNMNLSVKNLVRPKIYQFGLGNAVITNILDGYIHRNDMHPFVASNVTYEEVEAMAHSNHLPFPAMEHNFVASLIETQDKLIAIDPGFGAAAPAPTTGWYMEGLAAAGYNASDVDIVLISHCHPDHIGNLAVNGEAVFPDAEIVFGRSEFDYWKRGENISQMRQPTLKLFNEVALPLAKTARFVEPGELIIPGLIAIDAFGHSAGHMAFHFESASRQLLFLNDTTPHYAASFLNPEWHFFMDDDPLKASVSRRRILEMAANEQIPVVGFHLPFPSLGYVDRYQNGYKFIPATYQFNLDEI
jgi:glyoxylase-like metal-dependent hydrolase (beta-lactamase superfamily II)